MICPRPSVKGTALDLNPEPQPSHVSPHHKSFLLRLPSPNFILLGSLNVCKLSERLPKLCQVSGSATDPCRDNSASLGPCEAVPLKL